METEKDPIDASHVCGLARNPFIIIHLFLKGKSRYCVSHACNY